MFASIGKTGKAEFPRCIVLVAVDLQMKQLCDFVSQHTRTLFNALDITNDFLTHNPYTWKAMKTGASVPLRQ